MSTTTCNILPTPRGGLTCRTCGERFAPEGLDVAISRQEGGSDPEYQALVVTFTPACPAGHPTRQVLHLGYGPAASRSDALLLERLPPTPSGPGEAHHPAGSGHGRPLNRRARPARPGRSGCCGTDPSCRAAR